MHRQTANFYHSTQSQFPSYPLPTSGVLRTEGSNALSTVSPLLTPNGSFDTLRNLSPPIHILDPALHVHAGYSDHTISMMQQEPMSQFSTSPILIQPDTVILQDSTRQVVNTGTVGKKGRKRKQPVNEAETRAGCSTQNVTHSRQSNKKRKTTDDLAAALPRATSSEVAAVCGVGPITTSQDQAVPPAPPVSNGQTIPPPDLDLENVELARPHQLREPRMSASATDVWYFLWAVDSKETPDRMPENRPRLTAKPDSKFVACRLCG